MKTNNDTTSLTNWLGFSVENMDPSANPTHDFYRFAAGGWLDRTDIPETEGQINSFKRLYLSVNQQILTLLQDTAENSVHAPKGSVEQQVGDFFASAMDTHRLEDLGIAPLQSEFERIEAIATPADLATSIAHVMSLSGSPVLLTPYVMADKRKSDINTLGIFPGGFSLGNRDLYRDEAYAPLRVAFLEHLAGMLQLTGISQAVAAQQAQTIIDLETALARAKLSPVEASNPETTYNKMTVAELQAMIPHFELGVFFARLGLSADQEVIVSEPEYMRAFDTLLVERPIEHFKIYLRWMLLNGTAQYLSPAIAETNLDFFVKKLQGTPELLPREQRVAAQIQNGLGHPVAQLYVQEYFGSETRAQVSDIVDHIRAQFEARLRTNPWLDESTRAFALDKLARMVIRVGHPDKWIDYSGVEIRRDDYLGNIMRLNQFDITRNLVKAGFPVLDDEFAFPGATLPTTINAAYQPSANKIEICAAILQPPFFDPTLDAAVNYGTLGAVIGHEMTHGFDTIGRHFDEVGNMTDWWTANDSEEFEAFTNKLIEQYSQYEALPGVFVNGKLSVTENTADLGGVTLAFNALKEVLAERPTPKKIDGYTPQERFFIAWVQLWMSKERPEVVKLMISSDPHPPSEFRATGPLVNLDEFFTAFNIQPCNRMWREEVERVQIW